MYHLRKKLQEIKPASWQKNIIFPFEFQQFPIHEKTKKRKKPGKDLTLPGEYPEFSDKSVLQTLDRSGDTSAAMDEFFGTSGFDGHDGCFTEKSAEVDGVSDF